MSASNDKRAMLIVGNDVDGSWTVHECAGELLGRFPTCQASRQFAERQRRARPSLAIASSAGHAPRLSGTLTLSHGRGGRGEDRP